jgi:catechol 2,3-dioxygenase-like lactoylglutathione lyase family enzyme
MWMERSMIDHVSIGVSDIARAQTFYDAALESLGYSRLSTAKTSLGYGSEQPHLWILSAPRPVPPDSESGLHLCFIAPSRAAVDAFHQAGLAAGGKDNGAPGLRTAYGENYYAAFLIDPEGYRIEAHCAREQ